MKAEERWLQRQLKKQAYAKEKKEVSAYIEDDKGYPEGKGSYDTDNDTDSGSDSDGDGFTDSSSESEYDILHKKGTTK